MSLVRTASIVCSFGKYDAHSARNVSTASCLYYSRHIWSLLKWASHGKTHTWSQRWCATSWCRVHYTKYGCHTQAWFDSQVWSEYALHMLWLEATCTDAVHWIQSSFRTTSTQGIAMQSLWMSFIETYFEPHYLLLLSLLYILWADFFLGHQEPDMESTVSNKEICFNLDRCCPTSSQLFVLPIMWTVCVGQQVAGSMERQAMVEEI